MTEPEGHRHCGSTSEDAPPHNDALWSLISTWLTQQVKNIFFVVPLDINAFENTFVRLDK